MLRQSLSSTKRPQLWFVGNIVLGETIYQLIKQKCVCQFVCANDQSRREKVMNFANNQYQILITTTILERGVTFNDIDVIVLDADNNIYNVAALVQIAGRVGRKQVYQSGKVIFGYHSLTKPMLNAKKQILMMNKN